MKKILLLLLLTVLFGSNINAQDENGSSLHWGIRFGMNWATVKSDFDEGLEARTTGVIGIFMRQYLGQSFYVQPEVNYTLKGAGRRIKLELGEISQDFDYRLGFDYIEIPVTLNYNFGAVRTDAVKPTVFLGPFAAFNLGASLSVNDVPDSDSSIENVKALDYGIAFGTGLGFKVENIDVLLELRYTLSLTSFDDNIEQPDLRNAEFGMFTISTGFVLN